MAFVAEHGIDSRPRDAARSGVETAAYVLWAITATGIAVRLSLVEHDPHFHNVYLKVFAAAGDAFWNHGDLYFAADGTKTGFRYPPLAAAWFVPFASCGPVLGSLLWIALNFAALLLGLRTCFRTGFPFVLTSPQRAGVLVISVLIGITSLNNGQANPMMLGLMLLMTTGALAGQHALPAAMAAVCVTLKVYPLAYAGALGVLHPRQVMWLVMWLLLAAALPLAFQDWAYVVDQYRHFVELLAADDRSQNAPRDVYRDLRLVTASFGLPMPNLVFHLLQVLGGAAIVASCLMLRRVTASSRRVLEHAFSSTMCWFMLLGPATEKATYVLIAPSLAWTLITARQRRRPVPLAVAVIAMALAASSVLPLDLGDEQLPLLRRCPLPCATLALAFVLATHAIDDLRRSRR
jgi:hypothetical protein